MAAKKPNSDIMVRLISDFTFNEQLSLSQSLGDYLLLNHHIVCVCTDCADFAISLATANPSESLEFGLC